MQSEDKRNIYNIFVLHSVTTSLGLKKLQQLVILTDYLVFIVLLAHKSELVELARIHFIRKGRRN